jgi:hypothetical protein
VIAHAGEAEARNARQANSLAKEGLFISAPWTSSRC